MKFGTIWEFYLKALQSHPLLTKALTGGSFGCIGDIFAQLIIEKSEYNIQRAKVVSSYGFFETILEGHFWLNFLEKTFGSHRSIKNALLKTVFDMALFGPFEIALFMAWTNKLESSSISLAEKVRNDFSIILTNSYAFWLPTSIICFYFVPNHLRVLFSCVTSVVWDTFMSFATHNTLSVKSCENFSEVV